MHCNGSTDSSFVCTLESWLVSRCAVDAPVNDIRLSGKRCAFDDKAIKHAGLKMMIYHSWYSSPKLATLARSKDKHWQEKVELVENIGPN